MADPEPISGADALTEAQRVWADQSERLWQRAHALAQRHPPCDAGDIYHALRALQLSPSARLAAAFRRGRLRAHRG